jgi:hypothetical protein
LEVDINRVKRCFFFKNNLIFRNKDYFCALLNQLTIFKMKKNLRKIGFILALGTVSFSMTNCGSSMTQEEIDAAAAEMEAKLNGALDEAAAEIEAEADEAAAHAEEAVEEAHKCEPGKCEGGAAAEAVEEAAAHVEEAVEEHGAH